MTRNKYLTPRMHEVLAFLTTDDGDGDLVHARPGGWWFGSEQLGGRVGYALLRLALITPSWDSDGFTYYAVNEEGRKCLDDPNYQPEIIEHMRRRAAKTTG